MNMVLIGCGVSVVCACGESPSGAGSEDTESDVKGGLTAGRTVANPMDLRYPFRLADGNGSRREMADPAVVHFRGDYYLFASKAGGVWHSPDLVDWRFVASAVLPVEDYAPGAAVLGNAIIFTASRDSGTPLIFRSENPKDDDWEVVAGDFSILNTDPSFLVDDDRLYFYWGCSPTNPIYGVELDPDGLAPFGEKKELLFADPEHHGWEVGGDYNTEYDLQPWLEGAWVNKINDGYYLQYAMPGTEFKSYSDGVYTSDSPLGPFALHAHNPFAYKPEGFACGAGHGSTFADEYGNLWHVGTLSVSVKHMFERRLALFPVFVDEDGWLYATTKFGDYPMIVPDKKISGFDEIFPGWMLLSYNKKTEVSSSAEGFPKERMTDENIRTAWAAETGGEGEWAMVDLEETCDVYALQLNFAEVDTTMQGGEDNLRHRYIVETSMDQENWEMLLDKSDNKDDRTHDYTELEKAVAARYLRVSNLEAPDGNFAISGFRVFGLGRDAPPDAVEELTVTRSQTDRRQVTLGWPEAEGAVGYNIAFGEASEKLYHNYMVYDATELTISVLNTEQTYYFAIESFNENGVTPSAVLEETL